jgi:pimeloyl-ACP methyl ester carboxylesterase
VNISTTQDSNPGAYAQVNGLHMYYETHGSGIPVILLHGGLETCQMWSPVIPAFSSHYQVITPDSRGHGRTDTPAGNFSYPLMAEDIAQLIKKLRLNRPFVTGYSDGGQTALYMAINYPGLARGYMIGATELSMTDEWRQVMQNALGFEGVGKVNFDHIVQANPELIKSLQEKHDVFHTPGYWKTLLIQASQCWWDPPVHTKADFAKIIDPALFFCGDRDTLCPPEQSLEMYRMIKGAELAVIPNADHFSMMQQIELAIEVLQNFMQRVNASE